LLEGLYEGIASPGKWQGALQQVNTALGGVSAALVSLHRPSDQLTIEYAGAMIPDLAAGFAAMQDVDPGRAAVPLLAAGKIYIDHDFHGHAGLLRMPFYRDFLHPAGIGHYALIPVGTEADELPALSVQREVGRRSFTSRERQLMQAVQPHLRNALALRKQLQHQRAESLVLKSTLDALNFPLLVCSPRGRVVIGNAAGTRWLRTPGCPLTPDPNHTPAIVRRLLEQACGRDADEPRSGSLMLAGDDILVALPLAGVVDLAAEKTRLTKEIAKEEGEVTDALRQKGMVIVPSTPAMEQAATDLASGYWEDWAREQGPEAVQALAEVRKALGR